MTQRPQVIVFDVNETLSDMTPLAQRFADVGVPAHLAKLWFATLLRDGFALTAAGAQESFAAIGTGTLCSLFAEQRPNRDIDDAAEHIMAGFRSLPMHPDVPDGVRALRAAKFRLITFTNGSTSVAQGLFERAQIDGQFEMLLSVEDAGAWKPARAAYGHAARMCRCDPAQMLLVAVHPWDIDGANRAGMATAWISRSRGPYPDYFTPPTHMVAALTDLPAQLPQ